jgi:hypothetical protein
LKFRTELVNNDDILSGHPGDPAGNHIQVHQVQGMNHGSTRIVTALPGNYWAGPPLHCLQLLLAFAKFLVIAELLRLNC